MMEDRIRDFSDCWMKELNGGFEGGKGLKVRLYSFWK
jgi:hypothetical protein